MELFFALHFFSYLSILIFLQIVIFYSVLVMYTSQLFCTPLPLQEWTCKNINTKVRGEQINVVMSALQSFLVVTK